MMIDGAALLVYLVVANPSLTGINLHEWLGFGVLVIFLVHCVVHVDWVVDTVRNGLSGSWTRAGNLALDVLILIAFATVMVSGLLVSGAVLPAFGLYADGYYFWDPLHSIAAKVLLALLLVHVVVHWKWLYNFFRKKSDGVRGKRADGGGSDD